MGEHSSTRKPSTSRTEATVWPHGFFAGFDTSFAPAAIAVSKAGSTSSVSGEGRAGCAERLA